MKRFVITQEYENVHGKMPRGRGTWAFTTTMMKDKETFWFYDVTYGEAVRKMQTECNRRRISKMEDIIVLP